MSPAAVAARVGERGPPLPHGRGPQRIEVGRSILIDVVEPGLPTALVFSAVNSLSFSYYKLFNSVRINRVFVRDPENEWFQQGVGEGLDDVETLSAYLGDVLAATRPSRTFSFGSSMGGYASLLFGNRLGLDAVVSICPQTLLNPGLPHTPKRAPGGPWEDLAPALERASDRRPHYMFFGSADMVDIYNVYRLRHAGMTLLPIAQQDHMVMHHLMGNGEFERCVQALLDGRPYACETALDARCEDPTLVELVRRLVDGFYLDGPWDPERYARAILMLEPQWAAAHFMLAKVWARAERWDDAARHAARAVKRAPNSITFADFAATLFMKRKMYDEAEAAYERCLDIRPKHYAALCGLAALRIRAGREPEARPLLATAIAIRPRHTRARDILATLEAGAELAEPAFEPAED